METTEQMTTPPEDAPVRVVRLERELATARQALEDFTYSVSHDLRASLRHVNSYLKIAREDLGDGLDPAIASHLDTAAGGASHMGRLIDGLMELSKVGRADMAWGDVDLGRLLADIRDQVRAASPERDIRWSIAPDLPTVQADMALLAQMFRCLLDNAVQFTRSRPVAHIDIHASLPDGGMCELQIRDDGVGFDSRLHDRLFRVFQSLHSDKEFDGLGLGMGLALARRVVERHGGSIRADGEPGKGCCISLRLPIAGAA